MRGAWARMAKLVIELPDDIAAADQYADLRAGARAELARVICRGLGVGIYAPQAKLDGTRPAAAALPDSEAAPAA